MRDKLAKFIKWFVITFLPRFETPKEKQSRDKMSYLKRKLSKQKFAKAEYTKPRSTKLGELFPESTDVRKEFIKIMNRENKNDI